MATPAALLKSAAPSEQAVRDDKSSLSSMFGGLFGTKQQ